MSCRSEKKEFWFVIGGVSAQMWGEEYKQEIEIKLMTIIALSFWWWVYVRKKYEINRFSTSFYCLSLFPLLRYSFVLPKITLYYRMIYEQILWTHSSFIFEQNCPIKNFKFNFFLLILSLSYPSKIRLETFLRLLSIFETRFYSSQKCSLSCQRLQCW